MAVRILFIFITFVNIMALEITPIKLKLEYLNPKYIKSGNVTMKKTSRHSPYYININLDSLAVAGNNVTISILLLECISGRYIPTPFLFKCKLCDFFNEPIIGKMVLRALPANVHCPFPGPINWNNLIFDLEHFPYLPIFTYSDLRAQARLDVNLSITSTAETVLIFYAISLVEQSLESKSIKISKPTRKPKPINSQNLKLYYS